MINWFWEELGQIIWLFHEQIYLGFAGKYLYFYRKNIMKSFSQITRIDLLKQFGVNIVGDNFLPTIEPISVPSWLEHVISSNRNNLTTMRNEKSISEALIAPILMAVQEIFKDSITVFSGEPLITDELSGVCDF